MTFIHAFAGQYITQSVLHAFIALILVEISLHAWDIDDHLSMLRYRILTLSLPIIMFPVFQIVFPDRGSWYFRLTTALFDSQRWLDLKVIGSFPLTIAFLGMLAAFSLLFVMQEIFPIFRGRRTSQGFGDYQETHEYDARMQTLLESHLHTPADRKPLFLLLMKPFPYCSLRASGNIRSSYLTICS